MDYKEMYNKWLCSKKYEEMQKQIEMKKKNILQLQLNYDKYIQKKMENHMDKYELIDFLENLMEYHELKNEDKEAYEWIELELKNITDKDEFNIDYIRSILNLSFYLYKYELTEEFELCAHIRDAIIGETNDAIRILNLYFLPTDEDVLTIKQYPAFARDIINKNYVIDER